MAAWPLDDALTIDQEVAQAVALARVSAEDATRRLAGMTARRTANRHDCKGEYPALCRDRRHRRDSYHARFLLDALFEPRETAAREVATQEDYDAPVMWGSFTREDVKLLH